MAAFVNVSGRARLSYEVAPDTVNHYLEVELTCDNTSEPGCVAMLSVFVKQKKMKT